MKKLLSVLVLLLFAAIPAMATDTGVGIGVDIETEDFAPLIWMCDSRVVLDDNVERGRPVGCNDLDPDCLYERTQNYAFEGEQIGYEVLVLDKNGINKIEDVFMTIGDSGQGEGNDIEVNCVLDALGPNVKQSCNAYIGEEKVVKGNFDNWAQVAASYTCLLTVETPESMYGEYWVTAEVVDLDDLSNTVDENEYWFFNPVIALTVSDDLYFENVRPGTLAYSDTLLVGNDADEGSGVLLDMFISGTDFYDLDSSGAMCPNTNQLALTTFDYYATLGAYSTQFDLRSDLEGYVGINYGDHFDSVFYDSHEIIQTLTGFYSPGNVLAPGAEIAMTFRLDLPEPCNGDFDSGSIFFWGEAI